MDGVSINSIVNKAAWYKPSEEFTQFHNSIKRSKEEETVKEQVLDNLESMFDPERYDESYIKEDLNTREQLNQVLEDMNSGKTAEMSMGPFKTNNPFISYQANFYQTLQGLQAMFRLGVEKELIAADQSPEGGIALNKIDSELPTNLKMGWLFAQKYGEDSYIGIKDTESGESFSTRLRDTRSSSKHGTNMIKELANPDKSNFLVKQAVKKNTKNQNEASWKLDADGGISNNGKALFRGVIISIQLMTEFENDQDFEPPKDFTGF